MVELLQNGIDDRLVAQAQPHLTQRR